MSLKIWQFPLVRAQVVTGGCSSGDLTKRLFLRPVRSAASFIFSILLPFQAKLLCLILMILSTSRRAKSLFLLTVGLNPLPRIKARASLSLALGYFEVYSLIISSQYAQRRAFSRELDISSSSAFGWESCWVLVLLWWGSTSQSPKPIAKTFCDVYEYNLLFDE